MAPSEEWVVRSIIPVLRSLATLSTVNTFCELFNNRFDKEERRLETLAKRLGASNLGVRVYMRMFVSVFSVYK